MPTEPLPPLAVAAAAVPLQRTGPAAHRPAGPAERTLHRLRHGVPGRWWLAGVLGLSALTLCLAVLQPRQAQLARQQADAQVPRRAPPAAPAPDLAARRWAVLPPPGQLPDDLQTLARLAEGLQAMPAQAELQRLDGPAPLHREELRLRLSGPYERLRRLLGQLSQAWPHASLQALRLDRAAGGGASEVEASLTLRLHFRDRSAVAGAEGDAAAGAAVGAAVGAGAAGVVVVQVPAGPAGAPP
ncbi:hypothetical protein AACH10_19735 [Ideonella sp. DXS22W]|uniref:Uncharacterized protein n=1 Tax=Pseudaquabacterium inlustre TaxID=2984192 RepID=A0ABU9CKZ3_9BURK